MASITFVDYSTVIPASWLNAVNAFVYSGSGTSYAPPTTGSSILYANGSGGFSSVTIGSNLTFSGGTLSATGGGGGSYPAAGIANSTGSAWGTSYTTTGTGTVLALATGASLTTPTITSTFTWSGTTMSVPSGGATYFLNANGNWVIPAGTGTPTLQTVTNTGAFTTLGISVACNNSTSPTTSLSLGDQVNFQTGVTVYGMATQTPYIGMQNNLGGGSPNTVVLSGASFLPFTTTSTTNQNISLGSSNFYWSSLYLATTLNWGSYSISAPTGSTTTFLRNDGTWALPPSATTPTLQQVVVAGGSSTNDATFSTVTIGSGSAGPTGTAYGIATASSSVIGIGNSSGQVYLYGSAFIPSTTSSFTLGTSSYQWNNLYLSSNFYWGNVSGGITPPSSSGSASLFLNQQGAWVSASGSSGVSSFNTRTGAITLTSSDVTTALGYTPLNGVPTLQQVVIAGGSSTNDATFSTVTIGSGSTGPTGTAYGIATASSSVIGIGNSTSQVYLYGGAFIPATTNSYTLGNSTYQWANFYLQSTFDWNNYAIPAPTGSTSTFLRNDGSWATPTSTTPTLQQVVTAGGSSTNDATFSSVTIGSGTSGPTGTVYGIGTSNNIIGIGNSSANVYVYTTGGNTYFIPQSASGGTAPVNLGSSSYPFESLTITSSGTATTFSSPTTVFVQAENCYGAYVTSVGNGLVTCLNSLSSNHAIFYTGTPTSFTLAGAISSPTSSSVLYGTTSDRRLKTNITDYTNSGAVIDALQPRSFTWTNSGQADTGFIADEVQAVVSNAVVGEANAVDSKGDPVYQMVDLSTPEMMANIIAELKSLRARLKAANIA